MIKHPVYTFCQHCGNVPAVCATFCTECGWCGRCGCRCVKCSRCRKIYGPFHFCGRCGKCHRECVCKRIESIRPELLRIHCTTHFNRLNRILGTELELAQWGGLQNDGTRLRNLNFMIDHDRSVSSGLEMVSSPLSGDQFIAGMLELGKTLAEHGCTTDRTCGFHVHVDGRDLSYWEIRRLVKIYSRVEEDIYNYILSPERTRNRDWVQSYYARCAGMYAPFLNTKVTNTNEIKVALIHTIYGENIPKGVTSKSTWTELNNRGFTFKRSRKYGSEGTNVTTALRARYWGLNLHSWFYRGSIEFRMKEGSVNVQELVCWPLLCGWIVQLATLLPDSVVDNIRGLPDLFRLSPTTNKAPYLPEMLETYALAKIRQRSSTEVAA